MKKTSIKLMLFSIIFFGAFWSASAQVFIKVRPIAPVVIQTARPAQPMCGSVKNGMKMGMVVIDMAEAIGKLHLILETGGIRDIGIMTGTMVIIGFAVAGQAQKDNLK